MWRNWLKGNDAGVFSLKDSSLVVICKRRLLENPVGQALSRPKKGQYLKKDKGQ